MICKQRIIGQSGIRIHSKMSLTDVQQQLLRYFSLVNVSTVDDALAMFQDVLSHLEKNIRCNVDEFQRNIGCLNECVRQFDLEILDAIDEVTSEKLLALVNMADNNITQKAKFYDANMSQLFSKIVQQCIMSEYGHLSEIDCLNLRGQVNLTLTGVQSAILKMIKEKWLVSKDGRISLGMRSIIELEQCIKKHYPDHVKTCPLCKTFLVQGAICSLCDARIHFHCESKYHQKVDNCPSCKQKWVPVDINDGSRNESANSVENGGSDSSEEDASNQDSSIQSPSPAKRKRK